LNTWSVDRKGEAARFQNQKFDQLDNHRLLFHGTNIAVVSPIIIHGLRIMPHSGGRVGAGIYLASMQEKSRSYTSGCSKYACMFLVQAVLGKMHPVTQDGSLASSLRKAPQGYDSVYAKGQISPQQWKSITLIDPQNKTQSVQVRAAPAADLEPSSSFYHDEFLANNEAQVRLRYVLTVRL
jgi:poly [ADP-ribose] polymerase